MGKKHELPTKIQNQSLNDLRAAASQAQMSTKGGYDAEISAWWRGVLKFHRKESKRFSPMKFVSDEGLFAVSASSKNGLCTKVKFNINPSFPLNVDEAKVYGFEKETTVTFTCSAESINGTISPKIYIFSNTETGMNIEEGVHTGMSRLAHGVKSTWSTGRKIQDYGGKSHVITVMFDENRMESISNEVLMNSSTLSFKLWETTCDHSGTWKCMAVYQYLDSSHLFTYACRQELFVSMFPKNLRIAFQPPESSYYLGDSLKVLCTGFIGSMDATWVIESRMPGDPDGEWPKHYDRFVASSPKRLSECRTISGAVLTINITEEDDGRIFRCLIKRPGHWFAENAAPSLPVIIYRDMFTSKPLSRPQPEKSNECSVKVWTIFGATIGGVLLFVIIVEVSYYAIVVWRQKNSRRQSLFPDLSTPPSLR